MSSLLIEDFSTVRTRLIGLFPGARSRLQQAFDEIQQVIRYTKALGVSRAILLRPTIQRRAEAHRGGIMFECVRRDKRRDIIALGGRYDSLLEHFALPKAVREVSKVYGVGLSILVEYVHRK